MVSKTVRSRQYFFQAGENLSRTRQDMDQGALAQHRLAGRYMAQERPDHTLQPGIRCTVFDTFVCNRAQYGDTLATQKQEDFMSLSYSRYLCLVAGVMLLAVGLTPVRGQDANRDVVTTHSDVGSIVDRIQKSSGVFKDGFDKAVEHSMIDGTRLEANAKHRADDLHDAANRLGDVFHDKRDKNNPAVRDQVDKTIAAASELNRVMLAHRFTDKLQRDWDLLRSDLNALASVYELSPLEDAR